ALSRYQRPDRIPFLSLSGRGADATFESVAHHASTAADVALGNRTTRSGFDRRRYIFRLHVEAVYVVQATVERLGDNRIHEVAARKHICSRTALILDQPGEKAVAHNADAVRVREQDGTMGEDGLLEPGRRGHR